MDTRQYSRYVHYTQLDGWAGGFVDEGCPGKRELLVEAVVNGYLLYAELAVVGASDSPVPEPHAVGRSAPQLVGNSSTGTQVGTVDGGRPGGRVGLLRTGMVGRDAVPVVGATVGLREGGKVGTREGLGEGGKVGVSVGESEGGKVGATVGNALVERVGTRVG